jgi:hypothetical protein
MMLNANARVYVRWVSPFSMLVMPARLKELDASMFMPRGHKFALEKS